MQSFPDYHGPDESHGLEEAAALPRLDRSSDGATVLILEDQRFELQCAVDPADSRVLGIQVVRQANGQSAPCRYVLDDVPVDLGNAMFEVFRDGLERDARRETVDVGQVLQEFNRKIIDWRRVTENPLPIRVRPAFDYSCWAGANDERGFFTVLDRLEASFDEILEDDIVQTMVAVQTRYDQAPEDRVQLHITTTDIAELPPKAAVTVITPEETYYAEVPALPDPVHPDSLQLARNRGVQRLLEVFFDEGYPATQHYLLNPPPPEAEEDPIEFEQTSWTETDDDDWQSDIGAALMEMKQRPIEPEVPPGQSYYEMGVCHLAAHLFEDRYLFLSVKTGDHPLAEERQYRFEIDDIPGDTIDEMVAHLRDNIFSHITGGDLEEQQRALKQLDELSTVTGHRAGAGYHDLMEQMRTFAESELGYLGSWRLLDAVSREQNEIDLFYGRDHGTFHFETEGLDRFHELAFGVSANGEGHITLKDGLGAELSFELDPVPAGADFADNRFSRILELQRCMRVLTESDDDVLDLLIESFGEPIRKKKIEYPLTEESISARRNLATIFEAQREASERSSIASTPFSKVSGSPLVYSVVHPGSNGHRISFQVDAGGLRSVTLCGAVGHWLGKEKEYTFSVPEGDAGYFPGNYTMKRIWEGFDTLCRERNYDMETKHRSPIEESGLFGLLADTFVQVHERDIRGSFN